MNGEEVRKMKDEELKTELGRLRTKLFDLRSQAVTEKVENTAQFVELRKDVARLLTERNARRHKANPKPARATAAEKKAPAGKPVKSAKASAKADGKAQGKKKPAARATKKATRTK